MNWSIQYAESQNYVKIICEGIFTVEDCVKMKEDLLAQPFWRPGLYLFADFRQTAFEGLKLADLRFLAENHTAQNELVGGGKIAVLVSSMRDYGIGRQYELLTEATVFSEIMIFRDETKAINWLNSYE